MIISTNRSANLQAILHLEPEIAEEHKTSKIRPLILSHNLLKLKRKNKVLSHLSGVPVKVNLPSAHTAYSGMCSINGSTRM